MSLPEGNRRLNYGLVIVFPQVADFEMTSVPSPVVSRAITQQNRTEGLPVADLVAAGSILVFSSFVNGGQVGNPIWDAEHVWRYPHRLSILANAEMGQDGSSTYLMEAAVSSPDVVTTVSNPTHDSASQHGLFLLEFPSAEVGEEMGVDMQSVAKFARYLHKRAGTLGAVYLDYVFQTVKTDEDPRGLKTKEMTFDFRAMVPSMSLAENPFFDIHAASSGPIRLVSVDSAELEAQAQRIIQANITS